MRREEERKGVGRGKEGEGELMKERERKGNEGEREWRGEEERGGKRREVWGIGSRYMYI